MVWLKKAKRVITLLVTEKKNGWATEVKLTFFLLKKTGILHVNDTVQEKSLGNNEADFKTILNHLQNVYCGKIAYEFMHIPVSFTDTFKPYIVIILKRMYLSNDVVR